MDTSELPATSSTQSASGKPQNFWQKIKKNKFIVIVGVIVLVVIVGIVLSAPGQSIVNKIKTKTTSKSNPNISETGSNANLPEGVIAKVGDVVLPRKYLDLELAAVNATPSNELKKEITQKIINDEITLQYGQKNGLTTNLQGATNAEEYTKRIQEVQSIRKKMEEQGDYLEGEMVAIHFYNNGNIGAQGLERNKEIASQKINAVYNRVKNKEISLKQAGQILASDPSIAPIDSAYKENSYTPFHIPKGRNITFWPEFDKILYALNPGELSEVYLGPQLTTNGQKVDAIYIFGTITKRNTSAGYTTYSHWLNLQRGNYEIIE